ncbi:hypothetical protein SAMN05878426_101654 [Phaeovulum vinaykumarii]|uniref:Uncharacterized protein n=1 Tax=Phaeovulum vinaykumarii TaxID=407234 RepID=A0A1N7K6J6_9RHOB|nr:hypothetical protein SAMN05421795_101657 [Phaeovulum vinaykumarii]SOB93320.1 hypothetical protein SAMN05878426_101654 [Phaeovulum vinaykumarii]
MAPGAPVEAVQPMRILNASRSAAEASFHAFSSLSSADRVLTSPAARNASVAFLNFPAW